MIDRLFGAGTRPGQLKSVMDEQAARIREIAHRVSNATTPGQGEFAELLEGQMGAQEEVDLEAEMVKLADAQLRFEAAANLLKKHNAQLRIAMRGHV